MSDKLLYPKIMEPDQLEYLNNFVIQQLGTPIFFVSPQPTRPKTDTPTGRLYEIITGLYVIYKDYGMCLLKTYLYFCKCNLSRDSSFVFPHYSSVNKLRGGICHGGMPNGRHVTDLKHALNFYFSVPDNIEWPQVMSEMTKEQCIEIGNKLSIYSNLLVNYIKVCAQDIGQNEILLKRWRTNLIQKALNGQTAQYNNGNCYFDERIICDVEAVIRHRLNARPHQDTVKLWLTRLKPKIENGTISDSMTLYKSLIAALNELYYPTTMGIATSSADFLMGDIDI